MKSEEDGNIYAIEPYLDGTVVKEDTPLSGNVNIITQEFGNINNLMKSQFPQDILDKNEYSDEEISQKIDRNHILEIAYKEAMSLKPENITNVYDGIEIVHSENQENTIKR